MVKELAYCLELQDKFNTYLDPDWKNKRSHTDWALALWTELAEFLESYNWKWWKHTDIDYNNIALETVDFLHFFLSEILLLHKDKDYESIAKEIHPVFIGKIFIQKDLTNLLFTTSAAIKLMTILEINKQTFEAHIPFVIISYLSEAFNIMLHLSKIDLNVALKLYVYKNALNQLRQNYGYKSGQYKKLWDDAHEDNYFMMKLAKQSESFKTFEEAYKELEDVYKKLTNK